VNLFGLNRIDEPLKQSSDVEKLARANIERNVKLGVLPFRVSKGTNNWNQCLDSTYLHCLHQTLHTRFIALGK
jgi:hypothetical protein